MRALAVLALLAALVAGCGANDPVAAEEISAAAQETAEAGSSRIELSGEDGEDGFSMSGAADYEAGTAKLTFAGTTEGEPLEGELRLVGETFYMQSKAFFEDITAEAAEGKSWLSFRLTPEDRNNSLGSLVFPFPFIDPAELLATFEEVGGEPAALGAKDVRGVPTEGYRLELDFARLIERAPEKSRADLRAQLAKQEEKTATVEVWIDDADRVRRLVLLNLDDGDATVDFFDFGVEVEVDAPPADEVMDSDLLLGVGDTEVGSGEYEELPIQTIEEETP